MKINELKVGTKYKYKELCEILEEKQMQGNSKIAQLKEWKRYFNWSNPTKQSYLIEEIYDIPKEKEDGRKNNGGARDGAGNPGKFKEEFEYLFNYFLRCEYNKNKYNRNNPFWDTTYFNLHDLSVFFGFTNHNYYAGQYDENVDNKKYIEVTEMINRKVTSWIINKIKKKSDDEKSDITFAEGIIATRNNGDIEYKDEFLKEWYEHQNEYFINTGYLNARGVIKANKWKDMIDYISSFFECYKLVKKYKKISFNHKTLTEYDIDICHKYVKEINDEVIKELYDYFLKKEKESYKEKRDNAKWEFNNYLELYYQLCEYYNETPKDITQEKYYKDLREVLDKPFNEEEVMKPYVYIFNNYIKI